MSQNQNCGVSVPEQETTVGDEVQATTYRVQRRNTELINEAQRLQISLHAALTERDHLRTALQKKEAELEEVKALFSQPHKPNGTLAAV